MGHALVRKDSRMSSFCEVKCKGNALGTGARFAKQPNKDPSLTRAQKKFILSGYTQKNALSPE